MATAKTKKVALTRERRQETWRNLTTEQQAVLKQHIRYQHTSLFVDQNWLAMVKIGNLLPTTITITTTVILDLSYIVTAVAD
ncbi:hypothetical protein [Weissella sp. LMG 11983]|uniref:hypothetical protein n=1 Tax=Weissella sp. LMG 11983 TaxID=2987700 RepID=UPI0021F81B8D|nr:hypothetical protein [Weissella sp. LMG 11983]MCW0926269.1 hypothetical protein [Weissella sp. LMG 11983]